MPIERFVWTEHAEERLRDRKLTKDLVEHAIREGHPMRETNEGEADWIIDTGLFAVVYDHPDWGDLGAVRIVSVWTERRRRQLRLVSGYPS